MENHFNRAYKTLSQTSERFLYIMKMNGPQSATALAKEADITVEGARLQLVKLTEDGFVISQSVSTGVGRPTMQYSLTSKGFAYFPDAHTDLTVQLLQTIQGVLGPQAVTSVLNEREKALDNKYAAEIKPDLPLEEKLASLAKVKTQEGYMAEWRKENDDYLFIENHCPICMAARQCAGLCEAELNSLKKALGNDTNIERTEHIIDGSRRCVYIVRQ